MAKNENKKKQNEQTETPEVEILDENKPISEIDSLKEELQKANDVLLRTAAEYDNFKKRTERERVAVADFAKAGLLKKILPCMDNFDRALAADKSSEDYAKGLEMIFKQLEEALKSVGLAEIEAEGKTFDPNEHEAVMHIEDETKGEKEIVQVLQKGYKLGDTVIRPAMVSVAN